MRALDPLFSSGLGSFRWLLYFSDSRQSVGRAAKHPQLSLHYSDDGLVFLSHVVWRKLTHLSLSFPSLLPPPHSLSFSSSPYSLFQGFSSKAWYDHWKGFCDFIFTCFLVIPFCTSRWQCHLVMSLRSWINVHMMLNPSHHHSALSYYSLKPYFWFVQQQQSLWIVCFKDKYVLRCQVAFKISWKTCYCTSSALKCLSILPTPLSKYQIIAWTPFYHIFLWWWGIALN